MPGNKKLTKFSFTIAGITVSIQSKSTQIKERLAPIYKDYFSHKNPDLRINVKDAKPPRRTALERLIFQARSLRLEKEKGSFLLYLPAGKNHPLVKFQPSLREVKFYSQSAQDVSLLSYLLPSTLLSLKILEHQGILLHACGVLDKNKGYLFVASSGGGKSTLAALALQSGMRVLNDDRIFIRRQKGRFKIYGNPWHGKIDKTLNHSCFIRSIFFLAKARQNRMRPLNRAEAVLKLYENSIYLPLNSGIIKKVLYRCCDLAKSLDVFELGFKPDSSIWRFLNGNFKAHPEKK